MTVGLVGMGRQPSQVLEVFCETSQELTRSSAIRVNEDSHIYTHISNPASGLPFIAFLEVENKWQQETIYSELPCPFLLTYDQATLAHC